MAKSSPEIIFGAAAVARLGIGEWEERLRVLQKHGVKTIDTAYIYV